jgi:hypothetical protein
MAKPPGLKSQSLKTAPLFIACRGLTHAQNIGKLEYLKLVKGGTTE